MEKCDGQFKGFVPLLHESCFYNSLCCLSGFSVKADTVNIDFSFDNTYFLPPNYPNGFAGTVSGEIFGLTEGGTSAASQIVINTVPAGSGLFTGTYDLTNILANDNSFTLSNTGGVTKAYFVDYLTGMLAFNYNSTTGGFAYLQTAACYAGYGLCVSDSVTVPGYGALAFSLAPVTTTPIPSSAILMLLGLVGVGFLSYRRSKATLVDV